MSLDSELFTEQFMRLAKKYLNVTDVSARIFKLWGVYVQIRKNTIKISQLMLTIPIASAVLMIFMRDFAINYK